MLWAFSKTLHPCTLPGGSGRARSTFEVISMDAPQAEDAQEGHQAFKEAMDLKVIWTSEQGQGESGGKR